MAYSTSVKEEGGGEVNVDLEIAMENADNALTEETDVIDIGLAEIPAVDNSDLDSDTLWNFFGRKIPKNEAVYLCQVSLLCFIIVSCVINLSLDHGSKEMWVSVMSSSLGVMLPSPAYDRVQKKKKKSQEIQKITAQRQMEESDV